MNDLPCLILALNIKLKIQMMARGNPSIDTQGIDDAFKGIIDGLLDEGVRTIDELMRRQRRGEDLWAMPGNTIKIERVKKLLDVLEELGRSVVHVRRGCIVIIVTCHGRDSLKDLQTRCHSQELKDVCKEAFVPDSLRDAIDVNVNLDDDETEIGLDLMDLFSRFDDDDSPVGLRN